MTMPRWLVLTLLSLFTLVASGVLWGIAQLQTTCSFLDVRPPEGILPGPQSCGPDATVPAITTLWIIVVLLAAAFIVSFTVVRRRGPVLVLLASAMLLVLIIGGIATFVTTTMVPPIIYY